jgi:hypothetical protein
MFVASSICFGACTETITETFEGCHAYGELQFSTEAPAGWAPEQLSDEELLFVVEKPLRGSVEHIIREAVDSFAHPSYGDAWVKDFVMSKMTRVSVIDRSGLEQVLPALRSASLPPNGSVVPRERRSFADAFDN